MSVNVKKTDLDKVSSTTLYTPKGLKLFHGDHGLSKEHLDFIDRVFEGVDEGATIVQAFEMPAECPDLEDSIYGPCNGDEEVLDEECYFESRADRETKSRLVDRKPRSGARYMVIIGTKGVALWTAYGSLSGTVAPKEADDKSLSPEEAEVAKEFWAVHALAKPRRAL